jgi:hypothetical protein
VDGGKTFTSVETPHGDNHGMWFNPDNPNIILQVNDGGANVSLDGAKSWSSILNQPTAEYYMVAVDEQYPYRLYVPQQDNTTLVVPSQSPVSWGLDHPSQSWQQASGCETGGIWPRKDGSVIWGACKGEVGRYNVRTGQEKHYWVYPQNRYGHDPDEIKYRFPRQTVTYLSPHDDRIVYQASHVLHRSVDEGVTWETISPDLTAHDPNYQIIPGNPITRDITGEEVFSSIYSMVESRLEKGVIAVGANDGPVSITRDNGKSWKNVTPKDLGPGARIQNIDDSPHMKGRFYIAAYRYLMEHDLKPYLYRTDNYGESWTLLTDGRNGIPADYPTRVVREDPRQAGLLYAGTEFGMFVSFNAGRNWQTLQQNLLGTPITDIRAHRNDLVIATMGRSLWIMDNVTPLQQLSGQFGGAKPGAGALDQSMAGGQGAMPTVFIYQPRETIRYRGSGSTPQGGGEPEYPANGQHFDIWFQSAPPADARLEVLDAKGQVVQSWSVAQPRSGAGGQEMRGPFGRGGGGSSGIRPEAGMQRFTWDLRHPGPWTPQTPNGGGGGPVAAPGKYSVRLTASGQSATKHFDLKTDPRVTADGVTDADLVEQVRFQLQVRDAISEARRMQNALEQAMQKAGVKPPQPAPAGVRPLDMKFDSPLQELWVRIADLPGVYQQPMLLSQLQNIQRMIGQADQKVGKDAYDRFNDLMKELKELQGRAAKYLQGTTE